MNTAGRRAALVLAGITAAAWIYLLAGTGGAGGTAHVNAAGGMMMTAQPAWSLGNDRSSIRHVDDHDGRDDAALGETLGDLRGGGRQAQG
jgi:hypothetical protein